MVKFVAEIRILHVVRNLEVGGMEKVLIDLAKAQQEEGCQIFIVGIDPDKASTLIHYLHPNISYVNLARQSDSFCFKTIFKLCKLIRDLDVDIVHAHNILASSYASMACVFMRKPFLISKHGNLISKRMLEKISFFLAKRVVCVSEELSIGLSRTYAGLTEKLVTILNGVDTGFFDSEATVDRRSQLGISDDAYVLGSVGRLNSVKQYSQLIHFFAQSSALHSSKELHLVIVGNGPERKLLEKEVHKLQLEKSIHLVGNSQDVHSYLKSFDLFVLNSSTEGISIAILEAMASRVPALVTRVGGNPEIINHGLDGYLYEVNDFQAFSKGLEFFLQKGKSQLEKIKNSAHVNVVKNFSLQIANKKYLTLYENMLSENRL